jgi:gamma-glutamyltranspeptidase/glutathione hydrolase
MLHLLSEFDLRQRGRWSADTVQLICETMKRAYCDRARYLGDDAFVEIPERLTSLEYARQLAATIDLQKATPSIDLAPELTIADESPLTTHFSVIDSSGMAVSNTYTLEQSFGSKVVVQGAGFLLNNEMGDFNWIPGHTDVSGRIGTPANVIAPGKRMLSSQTPVIVTRDGEAVLVTGSPGGRTIINTVLCVLLNVLEFEMDLPAAVKESRLHQGWLPDELRLEDGDDERFADLISELRSRGQNVVTSGSQGDAHSIQRDPKSHQLQGVADGRRQGHARGY